MEPSETITILGIEKRGFWLYGFFIVLDENRAYCQDNENVWRYLDITEVVKDKENYSVRIIPFGDWADGTTT